MIASYILSCAGSTPVLGHFKSA